MERTRERVPLAWATTQNNLGNALLSLGEREGDAARLEEAVAAFRLALVEQTRERVPLDWAMTQNNLGLALLRLGDREGGAARLEEAIAAFRLALLERTRERVPLDWLGTQTNLGDALTMLGQRTKRRDHLCEALSAQMEAWRGAQVFAPTTLAEAQSRVDLALAALGASNAATAHCPTPP